jgi:hypothetical protein
MSASPGEPAASYLTLEHGTPVVDAFGEPVGHLTRVLTTTGPFFDGLIVATHCGKRFVDAPEVRRIHADRVELSITRADCEAPGLSSPVPHVAAARFGRTQVTEADRREAIAALKQAYVDDLLTADELGDRFEAVYTAATLDELERLIPR